MNNKKNTLVEIQVLESTVNFWIKVYKGKKVDVSRFYICHSEIYDLEKYHHVVVSDGYSFIKLCIIQKQIYVEFYNLNLHHYSGNITGNLYEFYLDREKFFKNYHESNGKIWKQVSNRKKNPTHITYKGNNLRNIRKSNNYNSFKKILKSLQNWEDNVEIYDDFFNSHDFTFHTPSINGGIILHTTKDGEQYYSIHT